MASHKNKVVQKSDTYKNYQDFIGAHFLNKEDPRAPTNTRISGGKFYIPDEEYPTFLSMYYRDIVSKGSDEFLTEKQRDTGGPIVVDFDFRYSYDVTTKQYTDKHIASMVSLYLDTLKTIFQFTDKITFPIYIFEKPSVNRLDDKKITKDGIHMIIGIQSDRTTQLVLRERVMSKIEEEWGDLPLTNTWEDVFDKGISAGSVNWQLYGSKKPNHDKYVLTRVYEMEYDTNDGEFMEQRINIKKFDWNRDFAKLSVRYSDHPHFFFKADFIAVHDRLKSSEPTKNARVRQVGNGAIQVNILNAKCKEDIDSAITEFLEKLNPTDYVLREAYELVMILSKDYYGEGSYLKWMKVGWALCNVSKRLFIAWVAFSAKSPTFEYDSIPDLYEKWANFDTNSSQGLTKRSIMYWAREADPAAFKRVHESGVDFHLNQSIKNISMFGVNKNDKNIGCGDTDIAKILYMMYKDQYACAALKADKWYRFSSHRWVEDECGTSLRKHISEELRTLYKSKCDEISSSLCEKDKVTDEKEKMLEGLSNKVLEIVVKLSQTTHKDHILKEAREQFYDTEVNFLDLLDSNPYLMCFKNGVLDIKNKVFRPGRAEDYLEKCTNINYKKLDRVRDAKIIAEVNDFIEKLFPIKKLRDYMWQHFASILVGVNLNQKLHMYIGGGENGKSVLTDLFSQCLGSYYAIVPITLISQPRQKQGTASPDIVALKGLRMAVMQEPSKDDKINDGAMKELSSCVEPIKGRNLNSNPITFVPQCKIVVCSNNFMKVNSQDHGTWRRIAVADFVSLFTDKPDTSDTERPYQYKRNETLKEQFPAWREVFMAMLVEIVLETQGRVDPCKLVDDSSLKYKEREDHIAEFIRDKIVLDPNSNLTKTEVNVEFNAWFSGTYGRGGPNTKEVHEYLDKKLGRFKTQIGAWAGARIRYERDNQAPELERDVDLSELGQ
jgi:P4 family phage/plasmid primase-like protien